jgi:peptide/nickel transport system permease protein
MYKYVLKRLLLLIPILMGITLIVFSIMYISPGDPAAIILGQGITEEKRVELREELGLDDPFLVQYSTYMINAVQGDFGDSYRSGEPVFDEIFIRFPVTFRLAVLSIVFAISLGIPLGIISAVKRYTLIDIVSSFLAMTVASIPGFWLGLMMIMFFSLKLGLLPSNGISSPAHYILPIISLGLPTAAMLLRFTRSAMLETISQDYIRTARSKGASEKRVIWHHALKNALLPVITIVGTQLGMMMGGAVITESVYAIPGLGTLVINAIFTKDMPQIMAIVLLLSSLFCLILLVVDLLYAYVDPRIKARYIR